MSTTNLFVELLVIGVGASIWLILSTLSVLGYAWVPVDRLLSPSAAVPALALVYVLGIISDRVADAVFELVWSDDLRGSQFRNRSEYYDARRLILARSETILKGQTETRLQCLADQRRYILSCHPESRVILDP